MLKPLNGEKTHPLSEHAMEVMRDLLRIGPMARNAFNPGVLNRLARESLIEDDPKLISTSGAPYIRLSEKGAQYIELNN